MSFELRNAALIAGGAAAVIILPGCNIIADAQSAAQRAIRDATDGCRNLAVPPALPCDATLGSGIPSPEDVIRRASQSTDRRRLDTIAPGALQNTQRFLEALQQAGIVTRLLEIQNLFHDSRGVPDYLEVIGTKAEKVDAVTDIVTAARAQGKQVYLELGSGSSLSTPSCAAVNKNTLCIGVDPLPPDPMLFPSPEGTTPSNPTDRFAVFVQLFSSALEGKVQADKVLIYHAKPTDEVDMILSGIKLLNDGGELVYVFDSDRGDPDDLIIRLQQINPSLQRKDFSPGVSTVDELNQKYGYNALELNPELKTSPSSGFIGERNPYFKKKFIVFRKSPQPKFTQTIRSAIDTELSLLAIQHIARQEAKNDHLLRSATHDALTRLAEQSRAPSIFPKRKTIYIGKPQINNVQLL